VKNFIILAPVLILTSFYLKVTKVFKETMETKVSKVFREYRAMRLKYQPFESKHDRVGWDTFSTGIH
jgi:hypothetical protein